MSDQTRNDAREALGKLQPHADYIAKQEAAKGHRLFAMPHYRSGPGHDERWTKATDKALAKVRQVGITCALGGGRGEMLLTLLVSDDVRLVPLAESFGLKRTMLAFAPTESVTFVHRP